MVRKKRENTLANWRDESRFPGTAHPRVFWWLFFSGDRVREQFSVEDICCYGYCQLLKSHLTSFRLFILVVTVKNLCVYIALEHSRFQRNVLEKCHWFFGASSTEIGWGNRRCSRLLRRLMRKSRNSKIVNRLHPKNKLLRDGITKRCPRTRYKWKELPSTI